MAPNPPLASALPTQQPAALGAAPVDSKEAEKKAIQQTLLSCPTPHTFTTAEIKQMNQIFGVSILLLQFVLFVNEDKKDDQTTYNQLLPVYRALSDVLKNLK